MADTWIARESVPDRVEGGGKDPRQRASGTVGQDGSSHPQLLECVDDQLLGSVFVAGSGPGAVPHAWGEEVVQSSEGHQVACGDVVDELLVRGGG